MPTPLFVLFALLLGLGLVDIGSGAALLGALFGRSPAWAAALIVSGVGLVLCAYGIYAKRKEVRWYLPLLLLTVVAAGAYLAIFTPGLEPGFIAALARVVRIAGVKVALAIIAVLILRSRRSEDYFASGKQEGS